MINAWQSSVLNLSSLLRIMNYAHCTFHLEAKSATYKKCSASFLISSDRYVTIPPASKMAICGIKQRERSIHLTKSIVKEPNTF